MKTLLLLFVLINLDYTPPVYWEQMSGEQQADVLQNNNVLPSVVSFYEGSLQLTDDDTTNEMLNTMAQPQSDEGVKAFYFAQFNKIVTTINPALDEALPQYIMSLVLNEPIYVLNYFIKHRQLMQAYCVRLGNEFYSRGNNPENNLYNFKQFQEHLTQEMEYYPQYQTILADFFYFIQKRMNELRAPHRQR